MDMYQKRKMRQEKKNSSKNNGVEKIQLNWLSCIYGDYHLNPYKMGIFKK